MTKDALIRVSPFDKPIKPIKVSPFDALPPELLLHVVSFTDLTEDYLSLILTCKAARDFLPDTLQQVMRDGFGAGKQVRTVRRGGYWGYYGSPRVVSQIPHALSALAKAHVRLEMKLSKTALPQLLICTTCGKLKDSATWFIDSHCQRIDIRHYDLVGGRKIFERICNPCAVESTVHCYSSKPNLQHNGKKCFVCRLCARMFNPEDEHKGKRIKSRLHQFYNATAASKFCEPCAKAANMKHPGIFKDLPKDLPKKTN